MPIRKASNKPASNPAQTDWAKHEFQHAPLPNQRLVKRLILLTTDFALQPTASIPQACGSWSQAKAAYRFFDNDAIDPDDILSSHVQATIHRAAAHPVVLCAQDTTTLNYSTHPQTRGLGPIGGNRDKTIGLLLHSTLALTPSGQPLGLLDAQTRARDPHLFHRTSAQRNRMALAEKESQKWMDSLTACQTLAAQCPDTTLVNRADREGDLYDLFAQGLTPLDVGRVHLLVRAQHNRKVAHPQKYLLDLLASRPVAAQLKVTVPRKNGQPGRVAALSIRHTPVTLRPPCLKEAQPPLTLWAVEARETRPPKGVAPVCWRLLTTVRVTCAEEALEKVRWYVQRWPIEVMHKVLKSGCKVEQRQLETADRLSRVVRVDLVVAWRVLALSRAGRETPDDLASDWLSGDEWRALWCYIHKKKTPPQRAPSVREAVRCISQLGGFLGRRHDGQPGPIVVWRGLHRLKDITSTWRLFQ